MKAAWYETQGPADRVLVVGEMADPVPGPGELLIRVAASGVNPGDVKKRGDAFAIGMPFPRIIPHSDGSGVVEGVGEGVATARVGERVWCFGAQSYRPFGTAAELVVVPQANAVPLPDGVDFAQGACLGIPGITGHRAVHAGGSPTGKTVLIQGGAGAVGVAAIAMARFAGARTIATVRASGQEVMAREAGAEVVLRTDGLAADAVVSRILAEAPDGVDHIVEVAFDANVAVDEQVLRQGGSIATYATREANPTVPFWPLVFKNVQVCFLGSDDFTDAQKAKAAADLSAALTRTWRGYTIARRLPLNEVAEAHRLVEGATLAGRVVLSIGDQSSSGG
ncbi:MAG: NADPH:quinone reductase [Planctomycetota bacterium]